jgi:hypothetical protein
MAKTGSFIHKACREICAVASVGPVLPSTLKTHAHMAPIRFENCRRAAENTC